MYCYNCGKQIDENAYVCIHCGVIVKRKGDTKTHDSGNALAIVGFIFAFILPVVGLACSILGYKKAVNERLPYKNLAFAGILVSVVWLGFIVAAMLFGLIIVIFSFAII